MADENEKDDSIQSDRTKSPSKKIVKYIVSLGLLWYILHSWLFPLAHHFGLLSRPHSHTCAHDLAWAIDAFAPKEPGVPTSQLAENFFLYAPFFPPCGYYPNELPQGLYRIQPVL
jgi:hypothetical protein